MGVIARICLYALLALGLNIVVGFAGLLDIGYVAFFGIGSYMYAFLASPHFGLHVPFLLALPIVSPSTAVSGVMIGAPTLRVRGDYLAMVTLGFGEIVYLLLVNLDRPINITGGPSGIIAVDPPSFAGFALGSNTSTISCSWFPGARRADLGPAARFRVGWAWQAIREDEPPPQAMGVNMIVAKLQAFAIGASFAGVGGGLLASWQRSVFPANFMFAESINILAMVILGGMGNLVGVVLGRRADRGAAGNVPQLRPLPAAGLRPDADGADDLPAAGAPDVSGPAPGGAGAAAGAAARRASRPFRRADLSSLGRQIFGRRRRLEPGALPSSIVDY